MRDQKISNSGHLSLCQRREIGERELEGLRSSIIRNLKKTVYGGSITACEIKPIHLWQTSKLPGEPDKYEMDLHR